MASHVITQLSEQPPVTSAVLRAELCPKAMPPLGLRRGRTLSPSVVGGKGGVAKYWRNIFSQFMLDKSLSERETSERTSVLSGHTMLAHAMFVCFFLLKISYQEQNCLCTGLCKILVL